jgi:predicted HicB family RNase H-like nuclease
MHCIAVHRIAVRCALVKFIALEQTHLEESHLLMKKDKQFTFRIPTDLKAKLQDVAALEGRSVAQICEAFLRAGSESYKKEGTRFLNRFLRRDKQS